jgi:hypothetical protein
MLGRQPVLHRDGYRAKGDGDVGRGMQVSVDVAQDESAAVDPVDGGRGSRQVAWSHDADFDVRIAWRSRHGPLLDPKRLRGGEGRLLLAQELPCPVQIGDVSLREGQGKGHQLRIVVVGHVHSY